MAIELKRLISYVEHMDITLLAGAQGLCRPVNWVHMVENLEASTFLEGGEVVFITGIALSKSNELFELIKGISQKNVCGIIINIGPYISDISNDVISYCEEFSIPLFEVSWKEHLSEIMRIFCFQITKSDRRYFEVAAAFKNAIYFPEQEELYSIMLSQYGFSVDWTYAVSVFMIKTDQSNKSELIDKLLTRFENYLYHYHKKIATFRLDDDIVIVFAEHSSTTIHDITDELIRHAKLYLPDADAVLAGVGRLTQSARCICKSYRQAKAILRLQEAERISTETHFYSEMGLYRILMGIDDTNIVKEFFNATLLPLIEYDQKNNTDLSNTLKSYLELNGSVKMTAEKLYVHRNTINYSLNRIEEILNIDLSNLNTRLNLMVAFMIKEMIEA